jgi:hypothetical protein
MAEIYTTFVETAPHRSEREIIFDAFSLYSNRVWRFLPTAPLWVNGGFVTHKDTAPHDVDVAFLTTTSEIASVFTDPSDAFSLLTYQGVTSIDPPMSGLSRLQPFGGLVDSFFVPTDVPTAVQTWKDRWSIAPNPDGIGYRFDILKGFVEVVP